jgi:hypothetical protein
MSNTKDWLPGKRELQLAMANTWSKVLTTKGAAWGVQPADVSELDDLAEDAGNLLRKAMSSDRTAVITAQCKEAFDAFTAYMRQLKARHFFKPPLTDADFISLELKAKDDIKTSVAPPTGQATADITYPGPHMLMLHMKPLSGTLIDPRAAKKPSAFWLRSLRCAQTPHINSVEFCAFVNSFRYVIPHNWHKTPKLSGVAG